MTLEQLKFKMVKAALFLFLSLLPLWYSLENEIVILFAISILAIFINLIALCLGIVAMVIKDLEDGR